MFNKFAAAVIACAGVSSAVQATSLASPVSSPPTASTNPTDVQKRVDEIAAKFAEVPITGMTIGISRNGKTILVQGYGYADLASNRKADDKTVYEIGSITKQFTAAGILRLAEQDHLSLDDPVSSHFPVLGDKAKGVTIRHLMSHTSGLFSGPAVKDLTTKANPSDVVSIMASRDKEFEPGERYRYNNNGYTLLGLIIERLSGLSYSAYLEKEFFRKLGLRSTSICGEKRGIAVAVGYEHPTRGPAVPKPAALHHPTSSWSAGAICSTAKDMLRWQDALLGGRVINAKSLALMTTPAQLTTGRKSAYGFGMFIDSPSGEQHLHHGGATSGFITQLGYYPADKTGVVVLTNGIYAGSIVEQIEREVLLASRGLVAPARAAAMPLSATEQALYAGTYDLGSMKLEVYSQGNYLRLQPPGQVAAKLLYRGKGQFEAEHDPSIGFIFRTSDGGATELVMTKDGRELPPAKRSST